MSSDARIVKLATGDIESQATSKNTKTSGRLPTPWLVFLHICSSLNLVLAVAVLISGILSIFLTEYGMGTRAFASDICLMIVALSAGICSPISVVYADKKSVKIWTGIHFGHLIFIALFTGLIGISNIVIFVGIAMVITQLIFSVLYAPLNSIKGLQRPPRCCC